MSWTMRSFLFLSALTLVAAGCGGRSRSTPPPGARWEGGTAQPHKDLGLGPDQLHPPVDRGIPDPDRYLPPPPPLDHGTPPPPPDKGSGKCVTSGGLCGGGQGPCCGGTTCQQLPTGIRLCLRKCTKDNPSTPLINEDTCPGATTTKAQICANLASGSGTQNYCLHRCAPALGKNSCPAGLACRPVSTYLTGTVNTAVCAYPPCKTNAECPVYLSTTCKSQGDPKSCKAAGLPASARCGAIPPGAPMGSPLHCVVSGVCDVKSGLCAPHKQGKAGAKVGDPCTDDRSCGGQMRCDMERTNPGSPVHARNGYCTIDGCSFSSTLTAFACPTGSACNMMYSGGLCSRSCDLNKASTCRNHSYDQYGDYECRAWNNLSIGGQLIVSTPVCESGDSMRCSMLQGTSLDCSSVGLSSNPTGMTCRHPKNGTKLTNKYDPSGYCLDTTASGK